MTAAKSVYVFPGQGRNITQSDIALFDRFPDEAKAADDTLGYSVRALIEEKGPQIVKETKYAQPVIFLLNHLSYLQDAADAEFAYYIGHSLGEFNALAAVGCLSFEDGLLLVKKRGQLMSAACAEQSGSMCAVFGKSYEEIALAIEEASPDGRVVLSNLNSPRQLVVSGLADDVDKLQSRLAESGMRTVSLNVGGAFHSKYMSEAGDAFAAYLDDDILQESGAFERVISCVTARPYGPDFIETLRAHMISRVNFIWAVEYAIEAACYDFSIARGDKSFLRLIDDIKFGVILKHQRRN